MVHVTELPLTERDPWWMARVMATILLCWLARCVMARPRGRPVQRPPTSASDRVNRLLLGDRAPTLDVRSKLD
jgi:hypothetical protein